MLLTAGVVALLEDVRTLARRPSSTIKATSAPFHTGATTPSPWPERANSGEQKSMLQDSPIS